MSAVIMVVWLGVSPAQVQAVQSAAPQSVVKHDLVRDAQRQARQIRSDGQVDTRRSDLPSSLR